MHRALLKSCHLCKSAEVLCRDYFWACVYGCWTRIYSIYIYIYILYIYIYISRLPSLLQQIRHVSCHSSSISLHLRERLTLCLGLHSLQGIYIIRITLIISTYGCCCCCCCGVLQCGGVGQSRWVCVQHTRNAIWNLLRQHFNLVACKYLVNFLRFSSKCTLERGERERGGGGGEW